MYLLVGKQLSLFMKENRALVDELHMANKVSSNSTNHEGGETEKGVLSSVHHSPSVDDGKGNKEDFDATEVRDVVLFKFISDCKR